MGGCASANKGNPATTKPQQQNPPPQSPIKKLTPEEYFCNIIQSSKEAIIIEKKLIIRPRSTTTNASSQNITSGYSFMRMIFSNFIIISLQTHNRQQVSNKDIKYLFKYGFLSSIDQRLFCKAKRTSHINVIYS